MFDPALRLNGLRVLVVDSDPDSRYLLTTLFESYGAEMLAVSSVEAALAALQQAKPNLVISEIGLPDADGYSFIRQVKALEMAQQIEIPAIALTIFARPSDRDHALAAGFRKHLPKPVDIDQLIATAVSLIAAAAGLVHPTQLLAV